MRHILSTIVGLVMMLAGAYTSVCLIRENSFFTALAFGIPPLLITFAGIVLTWENFSSWMGWRRSERR
ncbi:hypothetical protein J2X43_005965 [Rhizobium sp. BE258]|nr:hypothetical protein [Rhizobium sp. BE258]